MRCAGVEVCQRHGKPATRARCYLRSVIFWMVFLWPHGVWDLLRTLFPGSYPSFDANLTFTVVILVFGFYSATLILSVLRPSRGPVDSLAGTYLRPK